jgi:hypothetical protein
VIRPRWVQLYGRQAGVLAIPQREHLKAIRWRRGRGFAHKDLGLLPSAREQCGFTLLNEDF